MSNYDDDDDNEKQSKIQRDSRAFITRAIFFMVGLTLFALGLGHIHTKEPPQLSIDIKNMMEAQKLNSKSFEELDLELATSVDVLDKKVRARKKTGVIMETDEEGLELTGKLQKATII